ncbi:oxidoreductase [Actinomadura sp. NBRC 104412]|uniref:aldo/keto reductase n=1 Tax=Actinomadura sp. NBRC 104412 TaxID=3032203 RepID=UPI00249FE0C3|nr:aldo/keto reductase [Actinomadura sp. NBRC 104412]GLZ06584.1 oxidoreductase [Actinomadura sp. NBRC 104412]
MDIALGTMWFGTSVSEEESFAILDRFVEAGGTMLDTANNYAFWLNGGVGGESEEVLGRWLASRPGMRDRIVLGTKVGAKPLAPGSGLENVEGLSSTAITSAAEDSLRRLQTDHIDLYWAHYEDRSVPLEDTMSGFGELVTSGKVGRIGVSNHPVWRVERARTAGPVPYTDLQYRYSYLQPRPGVKLPEGGHYHVNEDLLGYARDAGLKLWAYTALLSGVYSGRPDRPLPEHYEHVGNTRRLAVLGEVADELGATRNQVVLAWLMGGDPPIIPIVGVGKLAHLEEFLPAAELRLDAELGERLDSAV